MSARGLGARSAIVLLALAPGIVVQAASSDAALPARLGLACLLAVLLEAAALRFRRQPLRPFLREGSALLIAVLLALWLPGLAGWQLGLALALALVPARQAFGGLGANVFNPVMAAVAFAQLAFGSESLPAAGPDGAALAWLAGGLLLCGLRILRWQAPVGLLTGALLAAFATGLPAASIASAPWLLAALFIVPEGCSSCESAPARLLSAGAAGALAVLASPAQGLGALPFAILAMNTLAPALDRWLAARPRVLVR